MLAAVTGGSGRLGNVLVRALLERGVRVRVLEPGAGRPASLEGLDLELVHGSILDRDAIAALCRGAERVFHLAAKVDLDRDADGSIFAVNVEGTRNVVAACLAGRTRLVHCSSHHALVRHPLSEPLDEARPLALAEPCDYHRAKAVAEKLVLDGVADAGLDAVICSPGTLLGPHDYEPSMIARALVDLYLGRLPVLMQVVSDFVDTRDVAAGMIAAAERGRRGERYLLSGDVLTMQDVTREVASITGRRMPKVFLPIWVGWALLPFSIAAARLTRKQPLFTAGVLRASVSNRVVIHEKAARELGFSPRPARASLEDSFAWYRARGWLGGELTRA
ncbi:MAG TPA: NAD-dependent epimerase/dehydratase family protein [Myxococcota bacterium]|jgi:dihydroflavonol-4-reductase